MVDVYRVEDDSWRGEEPEGTSSFVSTRPRKEALEDELVERARSTGRAKGVKVELNSLKLQRWGSICFAECVIAV